MNEPLPGWKTFVVGGLMIVYAGIGYYLDLMPATEATEIFMQGLGLIAMRLGIQKMSR